MLLGAGELGKEVIIALQQLGVETITVDRYADAPGHQVAHRSHVIDMTDGAVLRALIEAERPHLIVPEIEAIATDTLSEIEAEQLAVVIPTARDQPCPGVGRLCGIVATAGNERRGARKVARCCREGHHGAGRSRIVRRRIVRVR